MGTSLMQYSLYSVVCVLTALHCTHTTSVSVDSSSIIAQTGLEFISFSMDVSQIISSSWLPHFNYSSPQLHTLLQAMSPAIFRVGGSPADYLLFNRPWAVVNASHIQPTPVVMSKADWDNLVRVSSMAGLRLLFDLNLEQRQGTQWDPSSAIELFEYCKEKGYGHNLDWELGNEPNVYTPSHGQTPLSGTQIGKDYISLANVVHKYQAFRKSRIVGPDIVGDSGGAKGIIDGYLDVAGGHVDALTIHHYYFRGDVAHWADYLNPKHFDSLAGTLRLVKNLIAKSTHPTTALWIGETSDSWAGGTANVSDRYISAFLWLDKLGLSAQYGVDVVMRQTFWGHNYGLTDGVNFYPNPDYWLSLLHKVLVGTKVLNVTATHRPQTTRVYAQCTNDRSYSNGAIVMFALNVNQSSSDRLVITDPELRQQTVHLYLMEPGDDSGLLSKVVKLNGIPLKMVDPHTLPTFKPLQMSASRGILLPPTTYAFLVFPLADFAVCK